MASNDDLQQKFITGTDAIKKAFASLLVLVSAFALFFSEMGDIEGQVMPVVSENPSLTIEATEGGSIVSGSFTKLRACEFVSIEFSLVDDENNSARVVQKYLGDRGNNPTGTFPFGPRFVALTEEQLLSSGRAVVEHRCHPLWTTKSVLYEGSRVKG